jgi:hypothetical protein
MSVDDIGGLSSWAPSFFVDGSALSDFASSTWFAVISCGSAFSVFVSFSVFSVMTSSVFWVVNSYQRLVWFASCCLGFSYSYFNCSSDGFLEGGYWSNSSSASYFCEAERISFLAELDYFSCSPDSSSSGSVSS